MAVVIIDTGGRGNELADQKPVIVTRRRTLLGKMKCTTSSAERCVEMRLLPLNTICASDPDQ
jgi:hypothetical protein